ncbi:hypothetical protein EVAR_82367_1 [Eumeta japonica]|uniref:Uncharacterized protein n=1 Tax=Eumeta variegata TaxID=151549 RepID=A0A4C1U9Z0_EUMVA|nr:hypothetical protein EVAR_82367_1 [Eumeta japonica]
MDTVTEKKVRSHQCAVDSMSSNRICNGEGNGVMTGSNGGGGKSGVAEGERATGTRSHLTNITRNHTTAVYKLNIPKYFLIEMCLLIYHSASCGNPDWCVVIGGCRQRPSALAERSQLSAIAATARTYLRYCHRTPKRRRDAAHAVARVWNSTPSTPSQ